MKNFNIVWCTKNEVRDIGYRAALALREAVFLDEQGFSGEEDALDDRALHLLLLDGGELAACARLYDDADGRWHAGRIAVRRERRGERLGALLMRELEAKAAALGARELLLSAQVKARGFYEACGYRALGEFYYDEYCPHIDMGKELQPA